MKAIRLNIRLIMAIIVLAFIGMTVYFVQSVYLNGNRWMTNQGNRRIASARENVVAGDIIDRNGVVLAGTNAKGKRIYAQSENLRRAVSQTVGDELSMAFTGVETFQAAYLLGFTSSIADKALGALTGEKAKGDSVKLTIDAKLSQYISGIFPDGKKGAVVVLNHDTGEVLAMVSKPDYDPMRISKDTADPEDDAFMNRVIQGQYAPGSVFKIVTTAAAIDNLPGVTTRKFNCAGERRFGNGFVRDTSGKGHGSITFRQAFTQSCNLTFASLGVEVGQNNLLKTAENMGFNQNFLYRDLVLYPSRFAKAQPEYELAWSSVGQATDIVTPMHMALIASAVAQGGRMPEPQLLKQVSGQGGILRSILPPSPKKRILSQETSDKIKELMIATVADGTGKRAAIKGVRVAGKTGTAEISDSKTVSPHAWFVGFIDDAKHPLAIAVIVERGGSGGENAAPIAQKALVKAIDLGY